MKDQTLHTMKQGSPVESGIPRFVEATMALAGLIFAAPLIGLSSLAILLGSPGPIIYRQTRVGRHGRLFVLYKLRTMRSSNAGPQVTAGDDARITRVGMLLRKTKLDELPELWNVFKGDMSLVGPRPEVPRYVNFDDPTWRRVLEVRPGITDPVTLRLRNEETLLAEVKGDREQFYLDTLQPFKLRGYLQYLQRRSLSNDVKILWQTAVTVLLPGKAPPPTRSEIMNCFGSRASEGMLTRGRTRSEETTSR